MIISCQECHKKFEIDSNLIDDKGRLLQCGSCNYKWFFRKDNPNEINNDSKETLEKDNIEKTEILEKIEINNINLQKTNQKSKNPIKKINIDNKKKTKSSISFFNLLLILVISTVSFIILIDTFKNVISLYIPNIDFFLQSLYEILHDIFLFFEDLI